MKFFYQTGEEVKKGDRILFSEDPGEVEFVADPDAPNPETQWYIEEYGGEIMLFNLSRYGRVFGGENPLEDVTFVSRSSTAS